MFKRQDKLKPPVYAGGFLFSNPVFRGYPQVVHIKKTL
jgi:hypothetical protein